MFLYNTSARGGGGQQERNVGDVYNADNIFKIKEVDAMGNTYSYNLGHARVAQLFYEDKWNSRCPM